jgi:hypothetical protein
MSDSVQCPHCPFEFEIGPDAVENWNRVVDHFVVSHFDILYSAILAGFNTN